MSSEGGALEYHFCWAAGQENSVEEDSAQLQRIKREVVVCIF
jgi:hypothetical protein